MTPNDIAARIRQGETRLLFDTNALFGLPRLTNLCEQVQRLNATLEEAQAVRLFISAAAHAEKLFDLAQRFGDRYDEAIIVDGLQRKGLHILPFEEQHAKRMAKLLGERYREGDAWRAAKLSLCLRCLGMKKGDSAVRAVSGKRCAATVDWLIAAHALEEHCILVTDDRGMEFKGVQDKAKLEVVEEAISMFLGERESRATTATTESGK